MPSNRNVEEALIHLVNHCCEVNLAQHELFKFNINLDYVTLSINLICLARKNLLTKHIMVVTSPFADSQKRSIFYIELILIPSSDILILYELHEHSV